MKNNISKGEGLQNGQHTVSFLSKYGGVKASWEGGSPKEGQEYFVELEITDIVDWRIGVVPSEKEHYCIKRNGDSTILVCKVEIFIENGCCAFRIGSSIITLELKGEPYPVGTFVDIRTQRLTLYDMNL